MKKLKQYATERLALNVLGHTIVGPRVVFGALAAALAGGLVAVGQDPFALLAGALMGRCVGTGRRN